MHRNQLKFLSDWLNQKEKKPVIIRGARQVGKTWLVRELARQSGRALHELNFEKNPEWTRLFKPNDPAQILINLETTLGLKIEQESSILFLDEIQAAPELLAKLRWFAEELPKFPVIAAGSLLDFVLAKPSFSVPVGRIHYLHLEPLSFEEYLLAKKEATTLNFIEAFQIGDDIPNPIHEKIITLFKEYLIIGGMPAAISKWIEESSLTSTNQIHHDLIATYREDFSKYQGKLEVSRLEEILTASPKMLGSKFVYRHVNPDISSDAIKQALSLLEKARVCSRVCDTAANGGPLGAEIRSKFFKVLFLDIGLANVVLGLTLMDLQTAPDLTLIHQGAVAEQVVGQLLRTLFPGYVEPKNYYWQRGVKGSNAELDYLIQHRSQVIPIEVKSGSTGSLKSLHFFMGKKNLPLAFRINSDYPSVVPVKVKDQTGQNVAYTLMSLPFYLIGQIHRLVG